MWLKPVEHLLSSNKSTERERDREREKPTKRRQKGFRDEHWNPGIVSCEAKMVVQNGETDNSLTLCVVVTFKNDVQSQKIYLTLALK
jgi:hypothetical protein